jgi:signal transduction histidine kinase
MSDPSMELRVTPGLSRGDPRWYRSLYWRIALGLIAFLAVMLVAQGLIFLWLTDRAAGSVPARSPRRLAVLVASDLGTALANDPALDVERYVKDQYDHVIQPFAIVLRDGRSIANRMPAVPPDLQAMLRAQMERPRFGRERRLVPSPRGGDGEERQRPGGPPSPLRGFGAAGALRPRSELAAIVVRGEIAGAVAVPLGRPPFSLLVREFGPPMGIVGAIVLIVGSALIALVVFGPARRRLKHLQDATVRLGRGDLSARAPEHGGDEVAALAGSFNRMADDLAARAHALEASDRTRRQLLADVSHELMTPLTAMRGYVETLGMTEVQLDPATRERYLRIVDEETQRLERIIGDLLDLARLEGGGTVMRRERVSIQGLFDRVASRHERELQARGVRLVCDVRPGAEHVDGDPDRLEQVLQNLAANALRHTPRDGTITLSASRLSGPASTDRSPALTITIRDSGPGIPAEHLPLIFDRFYKADESRRAAGGSGLGLSIVRAIVERHGGIVTARNDGGAVFEIVLPA